MENQLEVNPAETKFQAAQALKDAINLLNVRRAETARVIESAEEEGAVMGGHFWAYYGRSHDYKSEVFMHADEMPERIKNLLARQAAEILNALDAEINRLQNEFNDLLK